MAWTQQKSVVQLAQDWGALGGLVSLGLKGRGIKKASEEDSGNSCDSQVCTQYQVIRVISRLHRGPAVYHSHLSEERFATRSSETSDPPVMLA